MPRARLEIGIAAFELLHETGLATSRNEARKLIVDGGGRLNDVSERGAMLSIREAEECDAEACSQVLCASIRELCVADHHGDADLVARWTANKTPERIARWIADPHIALFLAERDSAPAGVGSLSEGGEILLNYVAPLHRFCGVSRAMLAHLEQTLLERGVRRARLTSTETAHCFYRSAGWVDVGTPEVAFGIRGYPMEKDI